MTRFPVSEDLNQTGTAGQLPPAVANASSQFDNVLNYGAVADGVTDCWQAFTNAVEANTPIAGTIIVPLPPAGQFYRLSKQLLIDQAGTRLLGVAGSGGGWGGTRDILRFDAGVNGIGVLGGFSIIENLQIGSVGAGPNARTVTDAVVTAASTTITSATASFTNADVGQALLAPDQTSEVIQAHTYIVSVTNSTTAVMSHPPITSGSGQTVKIGYGSGLCLMGHPKARDVTVNKFPGHGIHNYGNTALSTNTNGWVLDHVWALNSGIDGFHTIGGDANAGLATACAVETAGRYGFLDASGLGNTYVMCQAAETGDNGYRMGGASVNASALHGCYRESDCGPNYYGQQVTVFGGVDMDTVTSDSISVAIYTRYYLPPVLSTQQSGTGGSAYTFALSDHQTVVEATGAIAATFTIPPVASVAWPDGTVIEVCQVGAGQVTIAAGAGVTLRSDGGKVKTTGQYATIRLRSRATNEWVLSGDLSV